MSANQFLLGAVVVTALAFDFTNGFHDSANAVAASVATGALKPRVAVALSGVLNFVGAFLSLSVAATIAKGIVNTDLVTLNVVFAGLLGAISWNLVTWYLGLPSSSSHALIGGVVGATLVAAGTGAVKGHAILSKVLLPAVVAPVVAGLVAVLGTFLVYTLTARSAERVVTRGFRIGQIGSASLVSLAHGTNDAQKTMGVITLALITNGTINKDASTPLWVVVTCALAISLGTWVGGWRVMRTLGSGLVKIHAPQGFAADGSTAAVLLASSHFGFPLSTTHIATGSILGSGVGKRMASVRWSMAGRMVGAWLVTLPAAALVGAVAFKAAQVIGGTAGVVVSGVAMVAFAAALYLASRRAPVNHININAAWDSAPPDRVPVPSLSSGGH